MLSRQTTEKMEVLFNEYRARYLLNNPGSSESDVEYRFISAIDHLMAMDPTKEYVVKLDSDGTFYHSCVRIGVNQSSILALRGQSKK